MFIKYKKHQEITSATILSKIKELSGLNGSSKSISIDTLCLIFRLNHEQIDLFVDELVNGMQVIRKSSQATLTSNPRKDSLQLI